ncbi:DUF2288 domain-containing protein [Ectothiorhodospiraceae bacterium BW-2]|nr:DUF2288 domain-containing protein [Ectothiorhodospiraceae bacterium BW-2]
MAEELEPFAQLERQKLNLETAVIGWHDLQRFFAAGRVLQVAKTLDLIEVATQMALDNSPMWQQWLQLGLVRAVADCQAATWYRDNTLLWAVVVRPWVLVQRYE